MYLPTYWADLNGIYNTRPLDATPRGDGFEVALDQESLVMADYSGLIRRIYIVDRTGSHVKLRYEHPTNEDDVRMVSVPMHDSINIGTLRNIADRSGANDFEAWCEWIDRNC